MKSGINIINSHYTFLQKISGVNIVIADLVQGLCEIAHEEKPTVLAFDGTPGEFDYFNTVLLNKEGNIRDELARKLEAIPGPRVLLCHNFHFPLFFEDIVKPFIDGALETGTPVINAIHDYSSNDTDTSKWLIDRGVAFTAVSEQLATDFRADGYQCAVVKNSINTQKFRPDASESREIRAGLNIPDDTILVGSYARAVPRKQFPQLVAAFSKVLERTDKNIILYIRAIPSTVEPGKTDVVIEEIQNAAIDCGVVNKVILETNPVPWETSLAPYFNAADLLVFPSINEGFGLQLPEAVATGTPFICSDIGCYAEIVKKLLPAQASEIIFPAGDQNRMIASILSALDRLDRMERDVSNARKVVENIYGLPNMVNGYMDLFTEAVKKSFGER